MRHLNPLCFVRYINVCFILLASYKQIIDCSSCLVIGTVPLRIDEKQTVTSHRSR